MLINIYKVNFNLLVMFEKFTKKPFKERMKDTGFLIKNSFTIIGKDKDIKTPTIRMIVLSVIITVCFYLAFLLFLFDSTVLMGLGIFCFALFILVPFKFFFNVREKANQSWIVYNTVCGKDISYEDAKIHTATDKGKWRIIALIDIFMMYASSQKGNKKGIVGLLISIFLSFLTEVWDLLSHYLLPAIVIEQKSIKEIIPEIKKLKTNVPATLTGVFGIDFVGSVVGSLFAGIFFIMILLSVGIGYVVALFTEVTVYMIGGISFSWVPIFVTAFIVSLIGSVYVKIVESIKVIYFTIFYTSIMRPQEISGDLKGELTHYLLMEKPDFSPNIPSPAGENDNLTVNEINAKEYIIKYKEQYTKENIKQALMNIGMLEVEVENYLNKYF